MAGMKMDERGNREKSGNPLGRAGFHMGTGAYQAL
jgi:hypothetical protein